MKTHQLVITLFCFVFVSCTYNYHITIKADKTAHVKLVIDYGEDEDDGIYVESEDFEEDYTEAYGNRADTLRLRYNSSLISNLTFNDEQTEIEYDIANVDSLLPYIDPFEFMFVNGTLQMEPNKLSYRNGYDKNYTEEVDSLAGLGPILLNFKLEFEQEVKKVKTNLEGVTESNAHIVLIKSSYTDLLSEHKKNKLDIKLK
ncbi:MAG: hypothetical protein AB8B72_05000 [Crocinitomicaceae bacterium]